MATAEIVQLKKETITIPFNEIEPLLAQARQATNSSTADIMRVIGYESGNVVSNWKTKNAAPLRAKYALLGMLAELRIEPKHRAPCQFDFDELTGLFAALQGWPLPAEARKALIRKIAKEMADG